jgi:hypothetical protein
MLGYFGFVDSTIYRNSIRKKNTKWWHELRERNVEKKDLDTETNIHDE